LSFSKSVDDKLAMRVDDDDSDSNAEASGNSTYFFIDHIARARINTDVFDEAEETLVVNRATRFRGDMFLGEDEQPVRQRLASTVAHTGTTTTTTASGVLMQQGTAKIRAGDVCPPGDNALLFCQIVPLPTSVTKASHTIMLTMKQQLSDSDD